MDLSAWTERQLIFFLLVFMRNLGLLISAPFFQSRNIPGTFRVSLALFLALLLLPVLTAVSLEPLTFWQVAFLMGQELLLGIMIGYILNLTFAGMQLAGQIIEVPMGIGMINVLDPQTGGQMPIIGQLYQIVAVWLFLLVRGDHLLVRTLMQSFKLLPVGQPLALLQGVPLVLKTFAYLFVLAVQIAIPIIGVLFLTTIGLGVLAKLIPQINVFFLSFPLKIFLGIVLLILSLPAFTRWAAGLFSASGRVWTELLRFLQALG